MICDFHVPKRNVAPAVIGAHPCAGQRFLTLVNNSIKHRNNLNSLLSRCLHIAHYSSMAP